MVAGTLALESEAVPQPSAAKSPAAARLCVGSGRSAIASLSGVLSLMPGLWWVPTN